MSSIQIQYQKAEATMEGYMDQHRQLANYVNSLRNVRSDACSTNRSFVSIYDVLDGIIQKLDDQCRSMESLSNGFSDIMAAYSGCENALVDQIEAGNFIEIVAEPSAGSVDNVVSESSKKEALGNLLDKFREFLNDVGDSKDLLDVVKTFLEGFEEFGDSEDAGILGKAVDYLQNLAVYFTGDKRGITGASELCGLAGSSGDLWTGLYDYLKEFYNDPGTGIFDQISQRRVKIVGVGSSFLNLASSLMEANSNTNGEKLTSIAAEYIDCGKNLIDVVNSGYELKHIGDVKSLSNLKAGPWSALDVYAAIGNAGVGAIAQGFRSYERYSADGKWDLGDTGATGIDISMAGLYGISHSLTLGLDDYIFGAIDKMTGGNGTDDMSYIEKAAEGYKILAKKCGEGIANWWNNLTS